MDLTQNLLTELDLVEIPETVGNLKVEFNYISRLSHVDANRKTVLSIDMSVNNMATLNLTSATWIKRVVALGNKIEVFTCRKASRLDTLSLGQNQLPGLDRSMFEDAVNLKILDLRNNKLERIDVDTFAGMAELGTIDLSGNMLSTLDVQMFDGIKSDVMKSLQLDLRNNKFNDESIKGLIKYFLSQHGFEGTFSGGILKHEEGGGVVYFSCTEDNKDDNVFWKAGKASSSGKKIYWYSRGIGSRFDLCAIKSRRCCQLKNKKLSKFEACQLNTEARIRPRPSKNSCNNFLKYN